MSYDTQLFTSIDSGVQTVLPEVPLASPQVVYLDFDGAETAYHNDELGVYIDDITIEDSKIDRVTAQLIVDILNEQFGDDIIFTLEIPVAGEQYSTIYVGKTTAFNEYGDFMGLAETIDVGNVIRNDNAFVFLDSTASTDFITSVIAHETQHITSGLQHAGEKLERYAVLTSEILPGEIIDSIVVSSGVTVDVYGTVHNATVNYGAKICICSGGVVNSINTAIDGDPTYIGGASAYVCSSGTANNTILNAYGYLTVSSGGTANSTTVNQHGSLLVLDGGVAFDTVVTSNGDISIYGGMGVGTLINSGHIAVWSGVANSITIQSGGNAEIRNSNSIANFTTIDEGLMYACSGGKANNTIINSKGSMLIYSDATASLTTVNGGYLQVSSGGTALDIIENGGCVFWKEGACVSFISNCFSNLSIYDSATLHSGTTALSVTINSKCWISVSNGGLASDVTIHPGGEMYINNGGVANGTTLNSGIIRVSNGGEVLSSIINNSGLITVESQGVANYTIINSGHIVLDNGANADYSTINATGSMFVLSGGIANNVTLNNGGVLNISSGGTANIVFNPWKGSVRGKGLVTYLERDANVYWGGTTRGLIGKADIVDSLTIDDENVSAIIYSNGIVNNMAINMGTAFVSSGGVVNATIVNGGQLHISSGGIANNLYVGNGTLYVAGILSGTLSLQEEAIVYFYDNSIIDFSVNDQVKSSEPLIDNFAKIDGNVSYTITVSTNNPIGDYILADNIYEFNKTVSVKTPEGQLFGTISLDQSVQTTTNKYILSLKNNQLVLKISDDFTAPVISLTADNKSPMRSSLLIAETDDGSDIYYRIDNDTKWEKYNDELTVTKNATYYFKAIDNAENVGTASITFNNIDREPPEITIIGDTSTPLKQASISAFTEEGVEIYFSKDDCNWKKYTSEIDVFENGTWYFMATDALGNIGTNSITFTNIDNNPPVIELTGDTTTPLQKSSITATTEQGLDIYYSQDNKTWEKYTDKLDVTTNGTWYFKATDVAGNVGTNSIEFTNIDTVAPVIELTGDTTTPLQKSSITATTEQGLGIYYSQDNQNWEKYTGNLDVTANGIWYFKATDAAGNVGTASIEFTNIDTVAPVIELAGDTTTPLQKSSITATSEEGLDIYYSTNNEEWEKYTGKLDVTANGVWYFRATDFAGNTGTTSIEFENIDTVAPVIKLTGDNTTPLKKSNLTAVTEPELIIYQSTNQTDWCEYTGPIEITKNGIWYFKTTDTAGNQSKVFEYCFANIDLKSPDFVIWPTISYEVLGITVSWEATDDLQLASQAITIDGQEFELNSQAIEYSTVLETGEHWFQVKLTDAVGNETLSEKQSFIVYDIDLFKNDERISGGNNLSGVILDGSEYDRMVIHSAGTAFLPTVSSDCSLKNLGEVHGLIADTGAIINGPGKFYLTSETRIASGILGQDTDLAYTSGITFSGFSGMQLTEDWYIGDNLRLKGISCSETGTATFSSGASVTMLDNKGVVNVLSDAYVRSVTNLSGGTMNISGGSVFMTMNSKGGLEFVVNGGYSYKTSNWGHQQIGSGGTASSATIFAGGTQELLSGGTNQNTLVSSGGTQWVNGGFSYKANILAGGIQSATASGVISSAKISVGQQHIAAGGWAKETQILNGSQYISSGGHAEDTSITGNLKTYSSSITSTYVYSGDYVYWYDSGGTRCMLSSGWKDSVQTLVSKVYWYGYTGSQWVTDGGIASATNLNSGSIQTIKDSGTALSTFVNASAFQYVQSDGIAQGTVVSSGGIFVVEYDGYAKNVQIKDGGSIGVHGVIEDVTIARNASYYFDVGTAVFKGTIDCYYNPQDVNTLNGILDFSSDLEKLYLRISSTDFGQDGYSSFLVEDRGYDLEYQFGLVLADDTCISLSAGEEYLYDSTVYAVEYSEETGEFLFTTQKVSGAKVISVSANTLNPTNEDVVLTAVFSADTTVKQYSLDGQNTWLTYSSPIGIGSNNTVFFRGFDKDGLVSDVVDFSVENIDKVKPVITDIIANTTELTNDNVVVTATFYDDRSLKTKQYRINNGAWSNYTAGVLVEENCTITFRAIDEAGNSASDEYSVANIDKTEPVIELTGDTTTQLQKSSITATTEEGLDIYYSQDNQNWEKYTGKLDVTANGTWYFKATDFVGNVGTASIEFTNIDTVAPVIELTGDTTTPLQKSSITATTELGVGIYYSQDNQNWEKYTGMLDVTTNGLWYFKATDAAGNTGTASIEFTNIDTVAPVIELTGDTTTPLQKSSVTATSEKGLDIYYSTNNEEWEKYTGMLDVTANGIWHFKATDIAGNTGTASIEFTNIDTTVPTVRNLTISEPSSEAIITISFQCDDDVVKRLYAFQSGEWIEIADNQFTVDQNGDVRIKLIDAAGNEGISEVFAIDGFNVSLEGLKCDALPNVPNAMLLSWYKGGVNQWTKDYELELSMNGQILDLPQISGEGLELHGYENSEVSWSVTPVKSEITTEGEDFTLAGTTEDGPKVVQAVDNGVYDAIIARKYDTWDADYVAQHQGISDGWTGTAERVLLNGKNKIADVFQGSQDSCTLFLTDDSNGDTLFVEDIYSELPDVLSEQQARIAQINEIRAGAGNDIVDMTSQKFAYVGNGVTIRGGLGNDVLWANKGDNQLFGDAGNDRLVGASGNDILVGGTGNDRLHGGGGNDIFCFCEDWGQDTVEQLASGDFRLWFADGINEDELELTAIGDNTQLTQTGTSNSVIVKNISVEDVQNRLLFGANGSYNNLSYSDLENVGAFDAFTSEKVFEDKDKGLLA